MEETFKLVALRLIDSHMYIHCLDLPQEVKEEKDIDIQACLNDHHFTLSTGDVLLMDAKVEESESFITVSGERRGWLRFKNITPISLPSHISDYSWWLPWEKYLTLFGKEREILNGVGITKNVRSEGYSVSHPKIKSTLIKHVIH